MSVARRAAVVVLGMHRSGTSALTRVLNRLGVDIGNRLLPPFAGNESGFWEHRDIIETHESLLAELGSSWDDVRPLPEDWWNFAAIAPHRQKLIDIIDRDFRDSPLWGFQGSQDLPPSAAVETDSGRNEELAVLRYHGQKPGGNRELPGQA